MTQWNPEGQANQAWASAPQPGQQQYPPTYAQPVYDQSAHHQQGYAQGYPQAPGHQAPGYPQPQGFAPVGPPPGYPPPPQKSNAALIVSLVVAAVLLIGGGVTAFLLLNKDDPATPTGVATGTSSSTTTGTTAATVTGPTISDPTEATTTRSTPDPTSDDPTSDDPTSDDPTSDDPTTDETSETGDGTVDTAYALAATFVDLVNEGDMETAGILVCENEQSGFIDAEVTSELELVDVTEDTPNMLMTVRMVQTDETVEFTMQPTDTGYFLICEGEMTDADLNW